MKLMVLTTVWLLSVFVTRPVTYGASAGSAEQIFPPIREKGDYWRFRAKGKEPTASRSNSIFGAYEIVFTGTEYKLFRRQAGINTELGEYYNPSQLDLEPTPSELVAFVDFRRVWEYLQFPFSVNQGWSTSYAAYTVLGNGRVKFSISAETHVVGSEDITVQDGTFKAFRIERQATATGTVGQGMGYLAVQHIAYSYFYAPTAGTIVKYDRKGGGSRVFVELLKTGHRR